MNTSRASVCTGKARHKTAASARIALARTGAEGGDLGLVFYRCPYCQLFHVGHPNKREQKQLRYQRLLKLIEKANHHAQ